MLLYGDKIEWRILAIAGTARRQQAGTDLDDLEVEAIKSYRTCCRRRGYNITKEFQWKIRRESSSKRAKEKENAGQQRLFDRNQQVTNTEQENRGR